ncbi:hypothetical protein J6590_022738 [Homalodisca vitripennis]|nr:hypothetical protein J6590_022738 [Homalodisca vitripennis]
MLTACALRPRLRKKSRAFQKHDCFFTLRKAVLRGGGPVRAPVKLSENPSLSTGLRRENESGKCVFLKISNTSLSTIDEDAFTDIDICKLDLSHNQLRWVPESLLRWDTLVAVDLQHNPWHCDCALQWMLSTVVPLAYRTDQQLLAELR